MSDTSSESSAYTVQIAPGISGLDRDEWNALNTTNNPFVSHEFLSAMEDSGSVGPGTGWEPVPVIITDMEGKLAAATPSYVKHHSQGEYVFDHAWANAWERAGGQYYPKLQIAAPFTPASGPRLLLRDEELALHLLKAVETLCERSEIATAHATFVDRAQLPLFERGGWLTRSDIQFHWHNRDYASFDEFLGALASRKRRALRKERAAAQRDVRIVQLSGDDIKQEHWDAFWVFYQDTGLRKWGTPYLTRDAFTLLGQTMAESIVLVMAEQDGEWVAGALNFVGPDTIYGRYWGCSRHIKFLHFELCYYQAIDIAIERGLKQVEAGAQGGHKLVRGYEPEQTWSAHWIGDPGFRRAVADFLDREREGIATDQMFLDQRTPFKKG
ncbi:GNAT family N-acetyltransferase [Erythrobacter sp. HA6-11]